MLGGLAMAGLITIYLPLCDGCGRQVSFGIAEELFKLSIKHGAEARYPKNWLDGEGTRTEKDQRYLVRYNAQLFAILAEQLLLQEGVTILYGTYGVDVIKKGENENVGGDLQITGSGDYAGASQFTDVVYRDNGIYSCLDRKLPGKKDDVSFAVTALDRDKGIAVGIITRIIKQNL